MLTLPHQTENGSLLLPLRSKVETLLEDLAAVSAKTQAEMESLKAEEKRAEEEEQDKFPLLQKKKNALYLITRTNWGKSTGDGGSSKGFVVNPAKNDLHPFRVSGEGDEASRNLVWEFIAAGVGAKWRRKPISANGDEQE